MKTRSSWLSHLVGKSKIYSKDMSKAISKKVWLTRSGYWLVFFMVRPFQSMPGMLKSPASIYIEFLYCFRKSVNSQ